MNTFFLFGVMCNQSDFYPGSYKARFHGSVELIGLVSSALDPFGATVSFARLPSLSRLIPFGKHRFLVLATAGPDFIVSLI